MDGQAYQVHYIGQVELERKITFKELPVVRSEFHQHFGAGAVMQRVRSKSRDADCSCRCLERGLFGPVREGG